MKENKVLLITGASSDIGCAAIDKLVDNYSKIVAHYCHMNDKLEKIKERLGEKIILVQADFSNEGSTNEFINCIKALNLEIDHVLHLPAQKVQNVKFLKCQWESYEREINISCKSIIEILRVCMPAMTKRKYGKVIIMLTSYTVSEPPKYLGSYVPIKYMLLGLLKSLAVEYADKGITINGISPEMMETKFLSEISDLVVEKNALNSPAGRNMVVEEIIPSIEFLFSEGADMITGQNIAITGVR